MQCFSSNVSSLLNEITELFKNNNKSVGIYENKVVICCLALQFEFVAKKQLKSATNIK